MKRVKSFIRTNVALGLGAGVVEQVGGNASGLSAMSGMMPTIGTTLGAGMALNSLRGLSSRKKRRK